MRSCAARCARRQNNRSRHCASHCGCRNLGTPVPISVLIRFRLIVVVQIRWCRSQRAAKPLQLWLRERVETRKGFGSPLTLVVNGRRPIRRTSRTLAFLRLMLEMPGLNDLANFKRASKLLDWVEPQEL